MSELGMDPERFWDLTLYDWSLWLYRIRQQQETRKTDHELGASLIGEFMALYANCHRDPKVTPTPYERKDFFPLSWDKKEEKIESEAPKQTGEELMKEAEIFKNKINGRKRISKAGN